MAKSEVRGEKLQRGISPTTIESSWVRVSMLLNEQSARLRTGRCSRVDPCWPDAPIQPGANVAVLISHFGFWSMNACRIVYVIDEHGSSERYGFAYGMLPDHGERGEERFTVELDTDQTVWYDLYAFSRPSPIARVACPFTRLLQKRFATDSKAAMQKAVQYSSK